MGYWYYFINKNLSLYKQNYHIQKGKTIGHLKFRNSETITVNKLLTPNAIPLPSIFDFNGKLHPSIVQII
jgi:hypothetical protein